MERLGSKADPLIPLLVRLRTNPSQKARSLVYKLRERGVAEVNVGRKSDSAITDEGGARLGF